MVNREKLEVIFAAYHHRAFVHPDPLEFLYDYPELKDREVVGLIASSLAYGRVVQILRSVSDVLSRMKRSPYAFLQDSSLNNLYAAFKGFRHRFSTGEEIASMLWGVKQLFNHYESLQACFASVLGPCDETVLETLSAFVGLIKGGVSGSAESLLPTPAKGSACKRLNLFLRWMVRQDGVDPGGWGQVPLSQLIVPLDTHMHRIGRQLQFTRRKQADMRTALEITRAFREISPEDPVRYDFSLTRLGIRGGAEAGTYLKMLTDSG